MSPSCWQITRYTRPLIVNKSLLSADPMIQISVIIITLVRSCLQRGGSIAFQFIEAMRWAVGNIHRRVFYFCVSEPLTLRFSFSLFDFCQLLNNVWSHIAQDHNSISMRESRPPVMFDTFYPNEGDGIHYFHIIWQRIVRRWNNSWDKFVVNYSDSEVSNVCSMINYWVDLAQGCGGVSKDVTSSEVSLPNNIIIYSFGWYF